MLAIIAQGKNPKHNWKKTLEADASIRLGRTVEDGWKVPWDKAVSRSHAELTCVGDRIEIRCLDTAKNAAVFNRKAVREFTVGEGDEFIIGDTTFKVVRIDSPRSSTSDVKDRLQKIRERLDDLRRSTPAGHGSVGPVAAPEEDPSPEEVAPPAGRPTLNDDSFLNYPADAIDSASSLLPLRGEGQIGPESFKDSDSIVSAGTSPENDESAAMKVAEKNRQKRAAEQAPQLALRYKDKRRADLLLSNRLELPLEPSTVCPHCWNRFFPDESLWIAEHPDLVGDPQLGEDAAKRFRPNRFKPQGTAIDIGGYDCHRLACPVCHLEIPRALFETAADIWSILGAPSCGKSYFLASMTHQLQIVLPRHFGISFGDIDPRFNTALNSYRRLIFENDDPRRIVAIPKTELDGDLYNNVLVSGQVRRFPQPFLFEVKPLPGHPRLLEREDLSRVLCLYDNAGEHFSPGADASNTPVTNHLAKSSVLFYLFDPTQDVNFRSVCASKSDDPQFREGKVSQQEIFVREAAHRVRRLTGCPQNTPHDRPLIVVVTKYDAWASALGQPPLKRPFGINSDNECEFDMAYVEEVSARVGDQLRLHAPKFVAAAESFCREVWFIPVSATGCSPQFDESKQVFGVRPCDMKPRWVETPFLFALQRFLEGAVLC